MPKYYCDYCDTFLTHDSPSVRKTHCGGRKHKENVRFYYQKWMEDQAQVSTAMDRSQSYFDRLFLQASVIVYRLSQVEAIEETHNQDIRLMRLV